MSLVIFDDDTLEEVNSTEYVKDVEMEFNKIKISVGEAKQLVRDIDRGQLISDMAFSDRFGYKQPLDYLSTGCKATLCTLAEPNKVISYAEAGLNARDTAIKTLRNGMIHVRSFDITVCGDNCAIDVIYHGKHFNTLVDFNKYTREV